MQEHNYHRFCTLPVVVMFIICSTTFASSRDNLFLEIPLGARENSMGETGVSNAEGGLAANWNPAFYSADDVNLLFQVFSWAGDSKGSCGGISIPFNWGGAGIYYVVNGIDDFEARSRPGRPESFFNIRQSSFAGGAALNINDNFSTGFTIKTVYEDIYGDTRSSSGLFDLGALYRWNKFNIGLNLKNLKLNSSDTANQTIRVGGSYRETFGDLSVMVASDGIVVLNDRNYQHIGVECGKNGILHLRTGYMIGHDSRSISYGFGIVHNQYKADIGFIPFSNELGSTWSAGIAIEL